MIQLKAFGPKVIQSAYLLAPDSRRQAFYTLWIESLENGFKVCRESGGLGKAWQQQSWEFETLEDAKAHFDERVRSKTNPERKSKRKYRLVHTL